MDASKKLVESMIDEDSTVCTIFFGKDVSEVEAQELANYAQSLNEDIEIELYKT